MISTSTVNPWPSNPAAPHVRSGRRAPDHTCTTPWTPRVCVEHVGSTAHPAIVYVAALDAHDLDGGALGTTWAAYPPRVIIIQHYCNLIEAPWLVNGGHGASLRHHNVAESQSHDARALALRGLGFAATGAVC